MLVPRCVVRLLAAFTALSIGCSVPLLGQPLDGTITYQGQLKQSGNPLNAAADFEFRLFNAITGGAQVGSTLAVNSVAVTGGVFTVPLNFGTTPFTGDQRWIEIAVRTPSGGGTFTTLNPRQPITAAPYALYALSGPGSSGPWATDGTNIYNTNTGNVGIGTTTPAALLHLRGTIPAINLQDTAGSTQQAGFINFRNNNMVATAWLGFGTPGSPDFSIINARSGGDIILDPFSGGVGIGTAPAVLLHARGTGPVMVLQDEASIANQAGYVGFWNSAGTETGWMGFGTPGSPHLSVVNNRNNGDINILAGSQGSVVIPIANVGINVADPLFKLHVSSDDFSTGYFQNTSASGEGVRGVTLSGAGIQGIAENETGSGVGVRGRSDSAAGFDFLANGAGTNYGSTSSRRWKRNIQPIDDPLHMLAQLRGVYYDWDAEHGGHHDLGMIAEEVGAVLPEIVNYEENGIDAIGMDYSKLTPLLVEAVKALQAEKDAEIAALHAENNRLRERLEAIERSLGQPSVERRNVDAP